MRIYYPTAGDTPPSILPAAASPEGATYVFPKLEEVP